MLMQTQTLHARKHCVPAYQASISRQKLTDLGVESESHRRPIDGQNNIDLYDHDQAGVPHPGFRGCTAQAPPAFKTLSHKNAIKPKNLRF